MTEQEWLDCTDPQVMLDYLHSRASERKLRLFACTCCRRYTGLLRGEKNRRVLEASEAFADDQISREAMEHLWREWYTFDYPFPIQGTWQMALSLATMTVSIRHTDVLRQAKETALHMAQARNRPERERQVQASLLRDIFGNPSRPQPSIDSSWLSWNDRIVPKLAQAMYGDRAFDRLPILADALEEAGCTNADILNHCRQPGEHARGCWIVDLLLGKT